MTEPKKPRRVRPVDDWRSWPRMWSVQVGALGAVVGMMPPDLQTSLLEALGLPAHRVPAVMGALFIAARLLAQPAKP